MSAEKSHSIARAASWIAGGLIALCVAILSRDYALASRRGPRDDQIIKDLQEQVKSHAALAPKLADEQKRVTAARLERKSRDNAIAWVLILAAAVFLTAAKRVVQPPEPAAPHNLKSRTDKGADAARSVPSRDRKRAVTGETACPTNANTSQTPSPAVDLAFVDQIVAQEGRGKEAAIILLQAIQSHYRYLPDEALRRLCELTEITPAEVAGSSSFYGQFRRSPVGRHVVRVCHGTACHVAGARQITEELRRHLAIPEGADTDAQRLFTVDEVACLGCCSLAPVLTADGHTSGRLTPATARDTLTPFGEMETA
jgi:NADH:ubiquinone oxidoreductase subunit E